jgi:acetolactate synthase-1/2/3 large subunit
MILGAGARDHLPVKAATELAYRVGAQVMVTASGRGAYPEFCPEFAGLVGLYASGHGARALEGADVILALGTALEETARMGWAPGDGTRMIHVDHDSRAFGRAFGPAIGLLGDVGQTVQQLLDRIDPSRGRPGNGGVMPEFSAPVGSSELTAPAFWRALQEAFQRLDQPVVLAQENGLCDLWGYHAPVFRRPDQVTCVVPGEQTTMGFGFGAALGAALAGRRVVSVGGDVAMECGVSSLLVAADRSLDILYIVLRNRKYGWPGLSRSEQRITTLDGGRDYPGFFASAGMDARRVDSVGDLASVLDSLLVAHGTRFLEVEIVGQDVVPGAASAES